MDIGAMVREIRGDRTQEQFATALRVSRQSIVWWETGKFVPNKKMLSKLGIAISYERTEPNSAAVHD